MTALNDEQVAAALADLPGWQQEPRAIRRVYTLTDFAAAIRFVNRVADLAQAHAHAVTLQVSASDVTIVVHSPEADGVTEADLEFARKIDR